MIGMIESVSGLCISCMPSGHAGYTKPVVLRARWGRADQKPKVYAGGAKYREKTSGLAKIQSENELGA